MPRGSYFDRVFIAALVCSAALVGNYLGLRSVRDALFQNWDIKAALPNIKIVTALVSVGTALVMSRILSRRPPQWLLPRVLAISGGSLLLVWGLVFYDEKAAGVAIYFQMAMFAGVMISAFWLLVNANYDPRSGKKMMGLIGAGGTAGGVLACLMVALLKSPRVMLLVFAGLHVVVAAFIPVLAGAGESAAKKSTGSDRRWGFDMLREVPYLRTIALMVLFASMTSFYLDYVLQSTVKTSYGGHNIASRTAFFGWYYTIVPTVTFLFQTFLSRVALEKAGLTLTAAVAPLSAVIGGAVSLFVPGLRSVVAARGSEMSLRNSFYKSAYEIFFLPIPAGERRAARSTIDVGADSMGDIVGGASAAVLRFVVPAAMLNQTALCIAMGLSLCGLVLVWRLKRAYVEQLEVSVMNRSVELDIADVQDLSTRNLMYKTIAVAAPVSGSYEQPAPAPAAELPKPLLPTVKTADPVLERIAALRSGEKERVRMALSNGQPLGSELVAMTIALLDNDQVVRYAIEALMSVAAANTGQLVDVLLDENRSPVVRRRIARLMLACGNQRAADGLLLGLRDGEFELRMVCARALANLTAKNPEICVLHEDIYSAVLREIEESHEPDTLEHIFTLLSMALPREPLQTAYEALRSGDAQLRGTMLEYLECTLPAKVREELWPMLEEVQRGGEARS